jgi:hypothetical protein
VSQSKGHTDNICDSRSGQGRGTNLKLYTGVWHQSGLPDLQVFNIISPDGLWGGHAFTSVTVSCPCQRSYHSDDFSILSLKKAGGRPYHTCAVYGDSCIVFSKVVDIIRKQGAPSNFSMSPVVPVAITGSFVDVVKDAISCSRIQRLIQQGSNQKGVLSLK